MTVIYNTNVKNQQLLDAVNAIDAGAGNGVMRIGTTGMASILAVFTLAKPCATVSNRAMNFSGLPLSTIAIAGGDAAAAEIEDSSGTIIISGLTVGGPGSGADAIINETEIVAGDIISLVIAIITG